MSVITLELRDLAYGGDAVGRYEGQVVFVPGGIPGETVEVEITERRKSFMRGRLLRVLSPAPERVEPPCPYAKSCGGCQWQFMDYAVQARLKGLVVLDQFRRVGRRRLLDPAISPAVGCARDQPALEQLPA